MTFQRNTEKRKPSWSPSFKLCHTIRFVIYPFITLKVTRIGNIFLGMKKIHSTLVASLLVIGFTITIHGNTGKGNIYIIYTIRFRNN